MINSPEHDDKFLSLYQSEKFRQFSSKKLSLILLLLFINLCFFFSLPFLTYFFPELMKHKLYGAFNVGLLLVILQYPLCSVIIWIYTRRIKPYDDYFSSVKL
jgi:uncharacterized membrane protein (DUF485 family)